MGDIISDKDRFLNLAGCIYRDGIGDLMNWLEKSDFYTAPASTRFHESYEGGLLKHSLRVYEQMNILWSEYAQKDWDLQSLLICSLFHDVCKVNLYGTEKRNRKNANGQWESYNAYKVDEKFCFGGHGSKSVYILQTFMDLKPEEAVAINCHMGTWEEGASRYVGKAFEQYPMAWVLHVADEAATFLPEKEVKKKGAEEHGQS